MTAPSLVSELEARTGLSFTGPQQARMRAALSAGARRTGCADEVAYAALVRRDRAAFDELVVALTVTEGYFFRDAAQMALLRLAVLPDLARRSHGRVEVWSAGCGAGEEAYTLAALATEAGIGGRVRVLGSDVSVAAVEVARSARYTAWSLRGVADRERATWFTPDDGRWAVRPDVAARVRFALANVLDGPPGRFDLVLCRNLLMYLTPVAVAQASEVFATALRPGGWLLTGASDPPLVSDRLVRRRTPQGLAYRLRGAEPTPAPPVATTTVGWPLALHPPVPAPEALPPPPVAAPGAVDDRAEAGRADAPADADARYRAAVAHLDGGDAEAAAREARAALYLDPGLVLAHLVVAHAARARGRHQEAVRGYRRAARALATLPPDELVAGAEGLTAAHLAALAGRLAGDRSSRG